MRLFKSHLALVLPFTLWACVPAEEGVGSTTDSARAEAGPETPEGNVAGPRPGPRPPGNRPPPGGGNPGPGGNMPPPGPGAPPPGPGGPLPELPSDPDELRQALLTMLPAPNLPNTLPSYGEDPLPTHAQTALVDSFDNTPADNAITPEGATLGRVLFYDRLLSFNGRVACASCHVQGRAFADPRPLSRGFDGGLTGRNSMGLVNARWYPNGAMFWDERAPTLEDQVIMPIQDPVEMGLTLDELVLRVSSADYYPPLFQAAFGTPDVDTDRIARALAQFVRSMQTFSSRWDEGVAQAGSLAEDFVNFTPQENLGKRIFFGQHDPATRGNCGTCHLTQNPLSFAPPGVDRSRLTNTAIFYMDRPRNNGIPEQDDNGFGNVTGRPQDNRAFKSPTLRNIELTGPYMHDGRFQTLEQVVRFYNNGVRNDPNLDPQLRGPNGQPLRLRLNPQEQAALVAFMRTLTDRSLTQDPRFSNPFPPPPPPRP